MYKPSGVFEHRPPSRTAQALAELLPEEVDTVRAGRVAWRRLRHGCQLRKPYGSRPGYTGLAGNRSPAALK
jgi:hypothetical protein